MTPMPLRTNFEHNHVLHENVVVMTIMVDRVPHVREGDRLEADPLGDPEDGITLITARLGYHDTADIPALLRLCTTQGLLERRANLDEASYFVSRAVLIRTKARGMPRWRKRLFIVLWHNAASPIEFFRLPKDRTVTVGGQIEI
jgi:KUP system potassium uptake protein